MPEDQETTETFTNLTIRLAASQRNDWQRRADDDGRPLTNWIRRMVERQIQAERKEAAR